MPFRPAHRLRYGGWPNAAFFQRRDDGLRDQRLFVAILRGVERERAGPCRSGQRIDFDMAAGQADQPLRGGAEKGVLAVAAGVNHRLGLLFDQRAQQTAGGNRRIGFQMAAAREHDLVDPAAADVAQRRPNPGPFPQA